MLVKHKNFVNWTKLYFLGVDLKFWCKRNWVLRTLEGWQRVSSVHSSLGAKLEGPVLGFFCARSILSYSQCALSLSQSVVYFTFFSALGFTRPNRLVICLPRRTTAGVRLPITTGPSTTWSFWCNRLDTCSL